MTLKNHDCMLELTVFMHTKRLIRKNRINFLINNYNSTIKNFVYNILISIKYGLTKPNLLSNAFIMHASYIVST